jgi:hypothetical protein
LLNINAILPKFRGCGGILRIECNNLRLSSKIFQLKGENPKKSLKYPRITHKKSILIKNSLTFSQKTT